MTPIEILLTVISIINLYGVVYLIYKASDTNFTVTRQEDRHYSELQRDRHVERQLNRIAYHVEKIRGV